MKTAVLILAISTAAVAQPVPHELLDPAYRAVLPADRLMDLLKKASCVALPLEMTKIESTWMPDDVVVAAADHKLPFALQAAIRTSPQIGPITQARETDWEQIANHVRQYAGIVVGGKKLILVSAVRIYDFDFDGRHDYIRRDDPDWRVRLAGLCDGGPSQFTALYDPQGGEFGSFTFMGTFAGLNTP